MPSASLQLDFPTMGVPSFDEPATGAAAVMDRAPDEPDLSTYDLFLLCFSGGKDSEACLLHLLEQGVQPEKIEMHHHSIDGAEGSTLMDWPSTPGYCRAVARTFGIRHFSSWKEGGFEREMLRNNEPTAPTHFERHDGTIGTAGGNSGKLGTRLKFPQTSASLSCRWCSAYLKIDVFSKVIANSPAYRGKRLLVVTGERAEESAGRAKYKTFEPDRSNAPSLGRYVDHWRPVHKWTTAQVWEIIKRHGVVPAPAYALGWGRLSCLSCIFASANQWATIRALTPERFERIAAYERQFGATIHRKKSVVELADAGLPYAAALANPDLFEAAMRTDWDGPIIVPVDDWKLPAGAFGESAGPL